MFRIAVPIKNEHGVSGRWSVGLDQKPVLPSRQAAFGDLKAEEIGISSRQQGPDEQNLSIDAPKIVRFENAVVRFGLDAVKNSKGIALYGAFDAVDSNLIGSGR